MTTVEQVRPLRPTTTLRGDDGGCPEVAPQGFFDSRRWGWTSGICQAVAHRFEVVVDKRCDVVPFVEPVTRALRTRGAGRLLPVYRVVATANPNLPYALYYDRARLTVTHSPDVLLRYLAWHVNQTTIERSAAEHIVIHAAAASRAGITVVLPGQAEHGKTTTVAGLLREGYDYVTDEAVVIDPGTLHVLPFPKALSVDEGVWDLFPRCRPAYATRTTRQWQVPPELFGSRSLRNPTPRPKLLVFPRYVHGESTRVLPLSRGEATRELAMATFRFQDAPCRNLRTLGEVVAGASVARLRIGSLEDAVLAIEELVSTTIRRGLDHD